MKKKHTFIFLFCLVQVLFIANIAFASPAPRIKGLNNKGLKAYRSGDFPAALAKWQEAFLLAEKVGDKRLINIFAANIGLAYAGLSEYEKAIEYYEKALQMQQETGNQKGAAISLNNIGSAYKNLGRHNKALEYYRRALAIRHKNGDTGGEARILANMGSLSADAGLYSNAFKSLEKARAVCLKAGNTKGEINVLINLGRVYTNIGQFDKALASYKKALELNGPSANEHIKALIMGNIGAVNIMTGDYNKAIDSFSNALLIHEKTGDKRGKGNDLANLGVVYKRLKNFDKALEYGRKALAVKQSSGDKIGEGAVLGNMGLAYEKLGDYKKALTHLIASGKIWDDFDLPDYRWRALQGRGMVEADMGNFDDAVSHYTAAIDGIENLRSNLSEKGEKASFMESKTEVYDELISLLMKLHIKYPSKGYDKKAFRIFEKKQGRVFMEEMGKSGTRNFSGIPAELIQTEIRLETESTNLQSALEEKLSANMSDADKMSANAAREKLSAVNLHLKGLMNRIKKEYPDYYALKYPEPVDLADLQKSVLKTGEIILAYNVMQDKTCMWAIGSDYFSMHVINSGSDELFRDVTAYRNNFINIFKGEKLRGIKWKAPESAKAESAETESVITPSLTAETSPYIPDLYSVLFPAPLSDVLKHYKTTYIVPTGPLYVLPFEALKDRTGSFLIEKQAFAYLSSPSILKVLRAGEKNKQPRHPFLAFANPVYEMPNKIEDTVEEIQVRSIYNLMRGGIAPLPETQDEVTRIKNILKAPADSHPLQIQEKASKSTLLDLNAKGTLDNYRYISFACHGIIPDDISGLNQPSLLLSTPDPVTGKIGLLTMSDVFGLKLNADLVALSACNTARGKIVKGEGVMGLTRAFMYAGTPSITVNLWSVETISAQKLSVGYFDILQHGTDRAEALRESKLRLLHGEAGEQFKAPFFWAPTVLFGDGK
ncbi:MAG: CHAT domain-containing protein [Deltaproteobacteria bacterium]|nr:CHAT domain-containing protein [Deltaproteobacteria bacterium]